MSPMDVIAPKDMMWCDVKNNCIYRIVFKSDSWADYMAISSSSGEEIENLSDMLDSILDNENIVSYDLADARFPCEVSDSCLDLLLDCDLKEVAQFNSIFKNLESQDSETLKESNSESHSELDVDLYSNDFAFGTIQEVVD